MCEAPNNLYIQTPNINNNNLIATFRAPHTIDPKPNPSILKLPRLGSALSVNITSETDETRARALLCGKIYNPRWIASADDVVCQYINTCVGLPLLKRVEKFHRTTTQTNPQTQTQTTIRKATGQFKVFFNTDICNTLPEFIDVRGSKFKVTPFIAMPRGCHKCLRFGHKIVNCRETLYTCKDCGLQIEKDDNQTRLQKKLVLIKHVHRVPKVCVNCVDAGHTQTDHSPFSSQCIIKRREFVQIEGHVKKKLAKAPFVKTHKRSSDTEVVHGEMANAQKRSKQDIPNLQSLGTVTASTSKHIPNLQSLGTVTDTTPKPTPNMKSVATVTAPTPNPKPNLQNQVIDKASTSKPTPNSQKKVIVTPSTSNHNVNQKAQGVNATPNPKPNPQRQVPNRLKRKQKQIVKRQNYPLIPFTVDENFPNPYSTLPKFKIPTIAQIKAHKNKTMLPTNKDFKFSHDIFSLPKELRNDRAAGLLPLQAPEFAVKFIKRLTDEGIRGLYRLDKNEEYYWYVVKGYVIALKEPYMPMFRVLPKVNIIITNQNPTRFN